MIVPMNAKLQCPICQYNTYCDVPESESTKAIKPKQTLT